MTAKKPDDQADLKIILLGDSAVGKSKLAERFLLDDFQPQQLSTFALSLYRYTCTYPFGAERRNHSAGAEKPRKLTVDFWDTAGQERFQTMHASYYHGAHACILVFDVGRKVTYKNLDTWYEELVRHRGLKLPVIVVANKIDVDLSKARKSFGFVDRRRAERAEVAAEQQPQPSADSEDTDLMPLFYASASDGTNVVSIFREAINRAVKFKAQGEGTFVDEVLAFIREEEGKEGGMFSGEEAKDSNLTTVPPLPTSAIC
ncbi:P-loop containing nucleoside triphosphate hydrolase protein [Powellomyces hirtus]|nr:P-loop containing nucleoside triphosphate hydrolase protein [Powellomyces hirtus]